MHVKRKILKVDSIPLIGCIAFGLIDRGTNLIQVRPTSICPLSCIFCSTDAGPNSKNRLAEYLVDLNLLIEWFRELVKFKGLVDVEAHIDTVGDPLTYPKLPELIQALKDFKEVKVVSLQTHGALLDFKKLDDLSDAGLDRMNVSIDALNPELARMLAGTDWYDVEQVVNCIEYALENTRIDVLIAPVWVPGLNDQEISRIIEFALRVGAGRKWPPLGIQKYLTHKYGRKPRGVREMSWREFYRRLDELSLRYKVKLKLHPRDFNIHKAKRVPLIHRVGEVVKVKVVMNGWLKGEKIGVNEEMNRVVTLIDASSASLDSWVKAKIISNKDNLYIARVIP